MARKTHKTDNEPVQEELDVVVSAEHAGGEVSNEAGQEEGREEEVVLTEDQRLAEALINLGYNEVYADAEKRVKKLTKQERAMLLERVMKPPK